jgi:hypothetical protein
MFEVIEPPQLRTQGDGRRLALDTIRALWRAGKIACSAHPEDNNAEQCGAFLAALVALEREGTSQARAGFAVVFTDLLGRAIVGAVPHIFEEREARGRFTRWKGEPPGQAPSPEGEEAPESCRRLQPAKALTTTAPSGVTE